MVSCQINSLTNYSDCRSPLQSESHLTIGARPKINFSTRLDGPAEGFLSLFYLLYVSLYLFLYYLSVDLSMKINWLQSMLNVGVN